jgi:hypothetical protein
MGQFDDERIRAELARIRANDAIKKSNAELDLIGRHLFNTEDGRRLLALLEEMYYKGPLVAETTEKTYFNLGSREVVRFLQSLHPKESK